MKTALSNYLSSVSREQYKLIEARSSLCSTSNQRYCDVPYDMESNEIESFHREILKLGYDGIHVGLTPLWDIQKKQHRRIIKEIGFGAAHGTSVKWQLRTNKPYDIALQNDRRTIDDLDPSEKIPLNYDLFAGNVGQTLSADMYQEHNNNAKLLMKALDLKRNTSSDPSLEVMSYIVMSVANAFKHTKRPIMFEVPGTLGFSMFPNPHQFSRLQSLLLSLFPAAQFCIDVGHLLTWREAGISVDDLIKSLVPLHQSIGMIHISSAGSKNRYFREAYREAFGTHTPDWHIYGLDVMLAVHEEEMLHMIKAMRKTCSKNGLIEVCETRKPSAGIADYFGTRYGSEIDDSFYVTSLQLQSRLLGYSLGL